MKLLLMLMACPPPILKADSGDSAALSADFSLTLENVSAPGSLQPSEGDPVDQMLAPGIYVIHDERFTLFTAGAAPPEGLEQLAEDGDPAWLFDALREAEGVVSYDYLGPLVEGTYDTAPMLPGDVATEAFTASSGLRLSLASMLGESNDVFLSTPPEGLALFTDGEALSGDLSAELSIWDAGTEQNEEPGLGPNQAPRQENPGDGEAEGGVVTELNGVDSAGYSYPAAAALVRMELGEVE